MDVPGKTEPATMSLGLGARDTHRAQIVLHQSCDTAEERDMAEQGSTMLLDSLNTFLTARATN